MQFGNKTSKDAKNTRRLLTDDTALLVKISEFLRVEDIRNLHGASRKERTALTATMKLAKAAHVAKKLSTNAHEIKDGLQERIDDLDIFDIFGESDTRSIAKLLPTYHHDISPITSSDSALPFVNPVFISSLEESDRELNNNLNSFCFLSCLCFFTGAGLLIGGGIMKSKNVDGDSWMFIGGTNTLFIALLVCLAPIIKLCREKRLTSGLLKDAKELSHLHVSLLNERRVRKYKPNANDEENSADNSCEDLENPQPRLSIL